MISAFPHSAFSLCLPIFFLSPGVVVFCRLFILLWAFTLWKCILFTSSANYYYYYYYIGGFLPPFTPSTLKYFQCETIKLTYCQLLLEIRMHAGAHHIVFFSFLFTLELSRWICLQRERENVSLTSLHQPRQNKVMQWIQLYYWKRETYLFIICNVNNTRETIWVACCYNREMHRASSIFQYMRSRRASIQVSIVFTLQIIINEYFRWPFQIWYKWTIIINVQQKFYAWRFIRIFSHGDRHKPRSIKFVWRMIFFFFFKSIVISFICWPPSPSPLSSKCFCGASFHPFSGVIACTRPMTSLIISKRACVRAHKCAWVVWFLSLFCFVVVAR